MTKVLKAKVKKLFFFLLLVPLSAYANVTAMADAAIGVVIILLISVLAGIYHLVKFLIKKVHPSAPISLQRVLGVLVSLGIYLITVAISQ